MKYVCPKCDFTYQPDGGIPAGYVVHSISVNGKKEHHVMEETKPNTPIIEGEK